MEEKKCAKCVQVKPIGQFNKKSGKKYQPYCRDCQSSKAKEWYAQHATSHKQRVYASKLRAMQEMLSKVREAKSNPCTDCGQKYNYWQMDFDHLRDKEFSIGRAWAEGKRWNAVKAEIEKCELVCANCHRNRTHARQIGDSSNGKTAGSDPENESSILSSPAF